MSLRANVGFFVMLTLTATACGSPPTAEIEAARSSLAGATTAGADKFAPDALKEAQAAQTALDAELKAQDDSWTKSYDRARELAVAARRPPTRR